MADCGLIFYIKKTFHFLNQFLKKKKIANHFNFSDLINKLTTVIKCFFSNVLIDFFRIFLIYFDLSILL